MVHVDTYISITAVLRFKIMHTVMQSQKLKNPLLLSSLSLLPVPLLINENF